MPTLPPDVPSWFDRVRKDPLGYVGANVLQLLQNYAERNLFQVAHIIDPAFGTHYGEHNEPNVPRDVGDVAFTGATPTMEAAKYATVGSHPGTGEIDMSFSGFTFPTLWDFPDISVQATSMSETGVNKPCIITSNIVSGTDIRFYANVLSSALGAGNAWAVEDSPFCFAIHGTPRPRGQNLTLPGLWARGSGLRMGEWNLGIFAASDLWAHFGAGHSQSTGVHAAKVVPKSWVHLGWNGSTTYTKLENSTTNPATTITRVGTGHVQVNFTSTWTLPAQPFFAIDYPRHSGGTSFTKRYVAVAPYSLQTTSRVELYIYSYNGTNWVRDDTDFWVTVYAA